MIDLTTTGSIGGWCNYTSESSVISNTYASTSWYNEYLEEKAKREKTEADLKAAKQELAAFKKTAKDLSVKKILKNGDYMTVLWKDDTKTIVKRAEDETASDYAAFTAAVAIKLYETNSALKRLVASAVEQGKKKKKKEE